MQLMELERRIAGLMVENARLDELNRALREDLRSGGFTVTAATVMVAVGGGLASLVTGRLQGAMVALLVAGCLTLLYNVFSRLWLKAGRVISHPEAS